MLHLGGTILSSQIWSRLTAVVLTVAGCIQMLFSPAADAKPRIAVLPTKAEQGAQVKGISSLSDKFAAKVTDELNQRLAAANVYEVIPAADVTKLLQSGPPSEAAQSVDNMFRLADGYVKLNCDAIVIPHLRFDKTGSFLKLIASVAVSPPGKITYTWGNGISLMNCLKVKSLTASDNADQVELSLLKEAVQNLTEQINGAVSQVPEEHK